MGSQFITHKIKADSSLRWSHAKGQIQSSTVNWESNKGRDFYEPKVTYTFDYKGNLCGGNTLCFPAPSHINEEEANSIKTKFPAGASVTVYFDPQSPVNSCLEPGDNKGLSYELYWTLGWAAVALLSPFFGKKGS